MSCIFLVESTGKACGAVVNDKEHRFCVPHYNLTRSFYSSYKRLAIDHLKERCEDLLRSDGFSASELSDTQLDDAKKRLYSLYAAVAVCMNRREYFTRTYVAPQARDSGHSVILHELDGLLERCEAVAVAIETVIQERIRAANVVSAGCHEAVCVEDNTNGSTSSAKQQRQKQRKKVKKAVKKEIKQTSHEQNEEWFRRAELIGLCWKQIVAQSRCVMKGSYCALARQSGLFERVRFPEEQMQSYTDHIILYSVMKNVDVTFQMYSKRSKTDTNVVRGIVNTLGSLMDYGLITLETQFVLGGTTEHRLIWDTHLESLPSEQLGVFHSFLMTEECRQCVPKQFVSWIDVPVLVKHREGTIVVGWTMDSNQRESVHFMLCNDQMRHVRLITNGETVPLARQFLDPEVMKKRDCLVWMVYPCGTKPEPLPLGGYFQPGTSLDFSSFYNEKKSGGFVDACIRFHLPPGAPRTEKIRVINSKPAVFV
jgi:hypothetical protein